MRSAITIGAAALLALAGCGASAKKRAGALPPTARVVYSSDQSVGGSAPSVSPSGKLVASLHFDPKRDGLSFQNYGFIAGSEELGPHAMRELFGDEVCVGVPSNSCTLTPQAQQVADQADDWIIGGHCYGFAVVALKFFTHYLSPAEFGADVPFGVPWSSNLASEIAAGWASQMLGPVVRHRLYGPPSALVEKLKTTFSNPAAPPLILNFRNGYGPTSDGHAVLPIGIQDLGGGKFDILIYDNNHPGVTRAVAVDTKTERWSYNLSADPDPPEVWSGHGLVNPMYLTDYRAGLKPCPSCLDTVLSGSSGVRISLAGDPVAHGHLLITSGGKRLGFVGGRFVNEIPGAHVLLYSLSQDWRAHPEPVYDVPATSGLTARLTGATSSAATIHVVGARFGATVSNLSSNAEVSIGAGGSTAGIRLLAASRSGAPRLQFAHNIGRGGSVVTLTPPTLVPGTLVGVALASGTKRLTISASRLQPLGFTLKAVGSSGSRVVRSGKVSPTQGRTATFPLQLTP